MPPLKTSNINTAQKSKMVRNEMSGHILAVSRIRQSHTWGWPFSKYFQIFYIFEIFFKYSNFQVYCPFLPFFCFFFWTIAHIPLLSRIGCGCLICRPGLYSLKTRIKFKTYLIVRTELSLFRWKHDKRPQI